VLRRQGKILILHSKISRYEMACNDFRQSIRQCAELKGDRLIELIRPDLIADMWLWHAFSAPRTLIAVKSIVGAPRP